MKRPKPKAKTSAAGAQLRRAELALKAAAVRTRLAKGKAREAKARLKAAKKSAKLAKKAAKTAKMALAAAEQALEDLRRCARKRVPKSARTHKRQPAGAKRLKESASTTSTKRSSPPANAAAKVTKRPSARAGRGRRARRPGRILTSPNPVPPNRPLERQHEVPRESGIDSAIPEGSLTHPTTPPSPGPV